jgi:quercetin dioxygenase-like cupin family protein
MAMANSQVLTVAAVLTLVIFGFTITIKTTMAADPDPEQDFCVAKASSEPTINGVICKPMNEVVATDFLSPVLRNAGKTNNTDKVSVTPANVGAFAGINTQGISFVRIDWAQGGINPPHVHPRATEILFLVEGSLYVGFITSDGNNTVYATYLQKGDLFVFPRGLIHFQLNVGKGTAFAISGLNSQNPGVSAVAANLFSPNGIKEEVLEKGFRTTKQVVDTIEKGFK